MNLGSCWLERDAGGGGEPTLACSEMGIASNCLMAGGVEWSRGRWDLQRIYEEAQLPREKLA